MAQRAPFPVGGSPRQDADKKERILSYDDAECAAQATKGLKRVLELMREQGCLGLRGDTVAEQASLGCHS